MKKAGGHPEAGNASWCHPQLLPASSFTDPTHPAPMPQVRAGSCAPSRGSARHRSAERLSAPHCSQDFSGIPLAQEGKCLKLPPTPSEMLGQIVTSILGSSRDTLERVCPGWLYHKHTCWRSEMESWGGLRLALKAPGGHLSPSLLSTYTRLLHS